MAPLAPLFEFTCLETVASLETSLGKTVSMLELLADACDSGIAYETDLFWIRRKWREVSIPIQQLDTVHRRINSLLFPIDLTMGTEVNGFVARRSTQTNAWPHVGARFLQKFDIKDFFTSISTEQVFEVLRAIGFGATAALVLSRLVSCNGKVPLGPRTSPRISNLVLISFDQAMVALAAEKGLAYSRYADDLSFSSQVAFDVGVEVEHELGVRGFRLNPAKTKSFKLGQPMFVTGLAVSDDLRPRLRKRFKARLRQEFYFVEKFGLDEHAASIGQKPGVASSRIMGQLHYARSIEPDFSARLESTYPNAFRTLIPRRADDRIERAQRHRQEFLTRVEAAPGGSLPFYSPTTSL